MSQQAPKRTHSWKKAKSDTTLLAGRSFNDNGKKAKVSRTLKLRKAKRKNSEEDCDDEAAKYNCMPQEVTKEGRLVLEVRSGKKRLQVWKACRVQLVMSTSYAMNTFGKKQFILMCITGGLLGLSKRYLSIPLADIHAIYKGGKELTKSGHSQAKQSFVVQTSDKQLHFRASTDMEMLDWVAEIKASLAVEKANGFLPTIFHVRIGPDQQVPMTDALLAFHPHRSPEQLHIRQALSETTLYTCYIADILRFGYAHEGALLWVEAQPRDSTLATEKILLLCPNNSRPDVVQALQCNLQTVLGGAGNTVQTINDHQTIYSVKDRFAVTTGGGMRRRPLSINLGAQSHQPRGAIRRHQAAAPLSPFHRSRPHSQTEEAEEGAATDSDWRMDVQKHKEDLVRHMHRNLLRKRSRSMGSIPTQGVPLTLPLKSRPAPVFLDPGMPEPLEVYEEYSADAPDEDSDSSDGCIRAAPPKGPAFATTTRERQDSQPSPASVIAERIAKEAQAVRAKRDAAAAALTARDNTAAAAAAAATSPGKPAPPVPPVRHDSKQRFVPLQKTAAMGAPGPDLKVPLAAMQSREPCYGELESLGSMGSSRGASPSRPNNMLQLPPPPLAPDNVSTASEVYVYDHLEIKAAYDERVREAAAATATGAASAGVHSAASGTSAPPPPALETIRVSGSADRVSVQSQDSWDDVLDYVPVSRAMMIKPSNSEEEEDNPSAGEYCNLKDSAKMEAMAEPQPERVVTHPTHAAAGTSGTATAAAPSAQHRSNCNSVFSCLSTMAGSSVDETNHLVLDPITGECDYDYPRSSRRATINVSAPSSPSPSCSSLSGSNSMEDIAASLWRRKHTNNAQPKRTLMPSGDTASFVTSLRKGAESANGGQQDRVIEDLLARLSPSRCRSPYHSGIGQSSSSKPPSPPDNEHQSPPRIRDDLRLLSFSSAANPTNGLLSPRQLTERASVSCHDLLEQLENV